MNHQRFLNLNSVVQCGMALVSALMIVAVAASLVAGLFLQQARLARFVENEWRERQGQWILRGGIDWAQVILREDAQRSTLDHLGEPWAIPLTNVPVPLVNHADAVLQGHITDAQARFNLNSLALQGDIQPGLVKALERLLGAVNVSAGWASRFADAIARQQQGGLGWRTSDQLAISLAMPAAEWAQVEAYVVLLPQATPINVNTAGAPVLTAVFSGLSPTQAQLLVARRDEAYFRDTADMRNRLPGADLTPAETAISFQSTYFFAHGTVTLDTATFSADALIQREGRQTQILWERESS